MKLNIYLIASFMMLVHSTLYSQPMKAGSAWDKEFLNFFIGAWSGHGEFANGKELKADLSFTLALDSAWITYTHSDQSPNQFKSISFWGMDVFTGQFVAYGFDNGHGHRVFESNGWVDHKLVLTNMHTYPKMGLMFQHFIYEKLTDKSMKMTYETSRDGIHWKLIDYVLFSKKNI